MTSTNSASIIAELFEMGIALAEKVIAQTTSLKAKNEDELLYKNNMFFFFCKAYKTYQAIQVLWKNGYAEDAFVLGRTLFELALQARYMSQDPSTRGRLFANHHEVESYRSYLKLKELNDPRVLGAIQAIESDEWFPELKSLYEKHKQLYPEGRGWWGFTISKLAGELGRDMKLYYASIYGKQSKLIHSGVTSANEYMNVDPGRGLKVNCYPSQSGDRYIPEFATELLVMVIEHLASALEIKVDADLAEARSKLGRIAAIPDETG